MYQNMECKNQTETCHPLNIALNEIGKIGLFTPILCSCIAFIGFTSNVLTLFAIPFAAKKKK